MSVEQARKPQGSPSSTGGRFDTKAGSAPSTKLERHNPLSPFVAVGFERRTTEHGQPAGACWHCGAGIANCVIVRDRDTGETVTVGMTCAERVGLSAAQVSQMLRDKFYADRSQSGAAQRAIWESERAQRDLARAVAVAAAAARHGTPESFEHRRCRCDECVSAVATRSVTVLVDAATGRPILDARIVRGQFGLRWVYDRPDGETVWLPVSPARRRTLADKGFVEAEAVLLERSGRNGDWADRSAGVIRLSDEDAWGSPVVGAAEFNATMAAPADVMPDWALELGEPEEPV